MPKYIDADNLKTILEERRDMATRIYGDLGGAVSGCIKLLDVQPAADVEPKRKWIPVTERLPEEKISPMTLDYQAYPCVFRVNEEREVRYYKFGRGHFWHGPGCMDEYVTHWAEPMELPEGESEGEGDDG